MGKALLGTHTSPTTLQLLDEVRSLRARVDELERALAEAETARDARPADTVAIDDREPVAT
jgi:cell division septum initiation protein DivIVA